MYKQDGLLMRCGVVHAKMLVQSNRKRYREVLSAGKNTNRVILTASIEKGESIHCRKFSRGCTPRLNKVRFCHYYG